ncbi:transposase [Pseudomonas putida]|uniref:transposase n=1 Tax=Pseudomonas putida TaxID=303 RepID=UPI000CD43F35|nr:transposase [Pseudomonas putida]MCE0962197.1 transposase [Pseudomonas putida]POF91299.1 transposase [Pseudomonas putida]
MRAGSRIIAPEGFLNLARDTVYHFLVSDGGRNRVRLIEFKDDGKQIRAHLVQLSQIDFEEAVEHGWLLEDGVADSTPPWLAPLEGAAIDFLESRRASTKESYEEKVNNRFAAISSLVARQAEVLASDYPDAFINANAKAQMPQQNAARLRLWFYSYMVFGRTKWSLFPPLHRIGAWNREGPGRTKKLGRPSRKGKKHGYRCDAHMQEKLLTGFLKYKSAHKTQNKIYSDILTGEFGCVAYKQRGTTIEFRHPDSKPFPSFAQFRYWISKMICAKSLRAALKGAHGARAQSGSEGSFSDNLINVNQRVEFDGYYISEKLSGLTEGSAVDSFCVVRAVCALSGMVLGIGFSEGKENMAAYRMAIYSMACDKVEYCKQFGLEISAEEWPSAGLSGNMVLDRGPAAGYEVEPEIHWLKSVELTPVYSGQSKATVESSHPRDKKILGQPTYFQSRLDFVQMAKREILRVLKDNHTSNAVNRMDEDMILAGIKPTPHDIYTYWSMRGRDSSIGVPFDTAVRQFLDVRPVAIRKDGVYLYGRKYKSIKLKETGIFDLVARQGVINTAAYVVVMCVRHIWIEVNGKLYELDFVRPARCSQDTIDISLRDLEQIDKIRRDNAADLREERLAHDQHYSDRFEQNTGMNWDAGERRVGRPSKGGAAMRDNDDFDRFRGAKK